MLPLVISVATVIRLRSRFDNSVRSLTSPNKTSSVSETSFGAKSPIALCAGSGLESRVFLVLRLPRMCMALV